MEHYIVTGSRQLRDVVVKLKPLKAFFENYKIMAIDYPAITYYHYIDISARQAAELSHATINRDFSLISNVSSDT